MAQLPPNAVALYRIMTEKSVIGFGKYADMTVRQVLCVEPGYIVWMYACKEKISLCRALKDELGLPDMKKPGVDEQVLRDWNAQRRGALSEDENRKVDMLMNIGKKRKAKAQFVSAVKAEHYTKRQLQAINHGHGNGKKH